MPLKKFVFVLLLVQVFMLPSSWAVSDSAEPKKWLLKQEGVFTLEIEQRMPDALVAFYIGRGMSSASSTKYANSCVFLARLTNTSKDIKLGSDFSKWRIVYQKKKMAIPSTEYWLSQWKETKESSSSQIAFQWSQFPAIQNHDPGDWYQGMFATKLAAGEKFDLQVVWTENGVQKERLLSGLICAN